MTVATQETYIEYAGDNSSTVFALDFPFVDATCLKAVKIDGNGVSTPVTITDTTGGSQRTGWGVTISVPVGTGYTLRIYRDTPMVQPKVYTENDPFPGRSHEIGLDRLTMIVQELRSGLISGEFSSNPATFVQGLELALTGSLLPGQIGFATDSRALLLKLQDGTVVRIPVDGGSGDTAVVKTLLLEEAADYGVAIPSYDFATIAEIPLPAGFFNTHSFLEIEIPVLVSTQGPIGNLHFIGYIGAVSVFGTLSTGAPGFQGTLNVRFFADSDSETVIAHCSALMFNQDVNINTAEAGPFDFSAAHTVTIKATHFGASGLTADIGTRAWATFEEIQTGGGGGAQLIGTAGGDLSGTYPDPTVVGIRGKSIPSLVHGLLAYNGEWTFIPLSAFDFVKRPGDSMTGKLEFKDGESDTEPGSIVKSADLGFNYLDIEQAGTNANIHISTENNSGEMTRKISVGPTSISLNESAIAEKSFSVGPQGSFIAPFIDFWNQSEPDQVKGRTFWDESNGTLTTMLRDSGGPDTKLQHGQEIMIPCFNDTGATIPSFRAVYISGSQGDKLKIALADPTDPAKTQVIGVTTESIADQEVGFVTFFGEVRNENTAAFTDGQEGFLSSAGGVIGTTVAAGDTRVRIGYCRRSHASTGAFFVAPMRYPMASDIVIDAWDDIPFLRGSKVGASAPTYAQFGATAFWGWKMASGNIFYHDDGQINHKWNLEAIRPHLHFSSDNGGAGSVTFEHRIMSRPASGGAWSTEVVATKSWTGTLAAGAGAPVLDLYDGDGFLPASPGPSTLIKAVLTMTAKTFTGNIFIDGWDAHYKLNRLGTSTEY